MKSKILADSKFQLQLNNWHNIGKHPTPKNILNDFIAFINDLITKNIITIEKFENLNLLDLFAGDCRIGIRVEQLLKEKSIKVYTSFVEVDPPLQIKPKLNVIKNNVFNWLADKKYHWIVMNPPYLSINSRKAKKQDLDWVDIKKFGSNLYALGIVRALELLEPGGMLFAITPFGWVRNEKYKLFRQFLKRNCSNVILRAYDKRNTFKGVNQDVAFQAFIKKGNDKKSFSFSFGYNGLSPVKLKFSELKTGHSDELKSKIKVFVGPIVWNRSKKYLRMRRKGNIPLVYGGNIVGNNRLNLEVERYKKKQYFKKAFLPYEFRIKAPAILIRRTLRGKPGNWVVDSCMIENKTLFTAENHVIVITLSDKIKNHEHLYVLLKNNIKEHYKISGNATISTKVVRQIAFDSLIGTI